MVDFLKKLTNVIRKNPAFSLVTPSLKPIEATIKIEQEERDELYHIGASFGKGDQPLQLEIGKGNSLLFILAFTYSFVLFLKKMF